MNNYSPSPASPVFSYPGPGQTSRPTARRQGLLRKSVPFVATFVLGVGVGASGSSGSGTSSQPAPTSAPTVVYSPAPVPTVVYSPSPVPTVVYSPSPELATVAPAAPPSPVPAVPEASEENSEGGASSGAGEAPAQPESGSGSAYYRNCKAARDAGAAPLYRGQPGYRSKLDADGDGIACEWK